MLFIVAATIPIALTGIFSYNYVSNQLITQKQELLASSSKSYGMTVYDRILNAEEKFNDLAIDIQANKAEDLAKSNETSILLRSTVPIFTDSEIYLLPTNSSKNNIKHLLSGNSKITISRNNNSLNIYFSKLLADGTRLFSTKIYSNFIFIEMHIFPDNENSCVIVKNKGTLFCSDAALYPLSKDVFEKNVTSENLSADNNQTNGYITASW